MELSPLRRAFLYIGSRADAIRLVPLAAHLKSSGWGRPLVFIGNDEYEECTEILRLFNQRSFHRILPSEHAKSPPVADAYAQLRAYCVELFGRIRPDFVAFYGDAPASYVVAAAAYIKRIPVIHLESQLCSAGGRQTVPQAVLRGINSLLTSLHIAPSTARARLLGEECQIPPAVSITGDLIADTLRLIYTSEAAFKDETLARFYAAPNLLVVAYTTARDAHSESFRYAEGLIRHLAQRNPEVNFAISAHMSIGLRRSVLRRTAHLHNLHVCGAQSYAQVAHLLRRSAVALIRSTGPYEEASFLGVPIISIPPMGCPVPATARSIETYLHAGQDCGSRAAALATSPSVAMQCYQAIKAYFEATPSTCFIQNATKAY
ncbi:UDP-N-acetylglucosamine 2-epimerase [Streptomyces sp. x-80]|uniref:UDP-N-acetylglucosamine 2-epimerase n=1 Tax=Streptomyces sp. x-80 TaxID=2789282 RepID=UPI00397F8AE4